MSDQWMKRFAVYTIDFAKQNPESYRRFFGTKRIHELNKSEQIELLRVAYTHDSINLENQK